jgi:hypothetical protein
MMSRQARASTVVMRLWESHDPGRSCLLYTIPHYVTNQTTSQNDGALDTTERTAIADQIE